MPSIRVGFGSDYTLKNQNIGIGTDNPRARLDVVGALKGDFNVSGVNTLSVYEGFVPEFQNVNENLTLTGEFNSPSEDIIVGAGITFVVSVGSTVTLGSLESISVQSHFSVPNGGTSTRPADPVEGMVRFNDDLNTLEFWNGFEWRQFTVTGASGRGVFGGGGVNIIELVNIPSTGNSINFGDLSAGSIFSLPDRQTTASSSIRGLFVGGRNSPAGTNTNTIAYITIASEGNVIDFGDLTAARRMMIGVSSSSRGVFGGGYNPVQNTIDYVQISTLGNALDFGDLIAGNQSMGGCSSPVRGIWSGGYTPTRVTSIQYITISSTGNAVSFGDLTQARAFLSGCSNSTRGIFGGGESPSQLNTVDYITIASTGNATYFGDLTVARNGLYACSNQTRGLFGGGGTPGALNTIDYVNISTLGNALDFGDLSAARRFLSALSDSHGGLGGF
jgi:hypothetical protein